MEAKLFNSEGVQQGNLQLPDSVFGVEVNEALLHQVITMYLANQRQGTAKAKTRAEVSGGGRKPWRQKGTGRARAGSNTSPVWVRGSKAFGPEPRDYYKTIPTKMKRKALACACSAKANDGKVMVVDNLTVEEPKTKIISTLFEKMEIKNGKKLFVIDNDDKKLYLSSRNIKDVNTRRLSDLNAYDVLNCENLVFAKKELVEKLKEVVASE